MREKEIEELKTEEQPKEKEFYILVNYYEGAMPYITVSDKIDAWEAKADKIYKIIIPFKELLK